MVMKLSIHQFFFGYMVYPIIYKGFSTSQVVPGYTEKNLYQNQLVQVITPQ